MPQCHFCHTPPKPDEDIYGGCLPCLRMYLERVVWPELRALLRQFTPTDADVEHTRTARTALYDRALPEMANAAPGLAQTMPLASHVKHQVGIWRIFRRGQKQYETHANHAHPAVELVTHLGEATYWRRVYRRYLRQRFGILASSRGFDGLSTSRSFSPDEMDEMTTAVAMYLFCDTKFYACLLSACAAQACGADTHGIVTAALDGARAVLGAFSSLVAQIMASPRARQRDEAILSMAGVLRPHLRMYPSVRWALGQTGDPRTVFLERLPDIVWQAYCAGARDMSELLESVRRLVNQVRRKQSKKTLHHTPEPVRERLAGHPHQKNPGELEEWVARQEALQHLDALISRANLSPGEAEFLALHRRGLSYSAIASQKGVVVGTVKTTMFRAYVKLRNAAHP
jgi:hypothetical protein